MEAEYVPIKTSDKASWTYCFRQVLVASVLWTSYIIAGLNMGTPTVAIPQLRKEANSTAAVSDAVASWMTSTTGYSGSICIFIIVPIGHYLGRKFTIKIIFVSTLISYSIIYFCKTAMHIIISQMILGLTAAAQTSVFLLTLTEYSSPKYRGVFLTLKSASVYWGMWVANAIGIFTHYKYIGLVGIFTSTYSLIISFIIPESPYWLAYRGRYDECAVAHRWLKGVNEDAEEELNVLIKSQKEPVKNFDSVQSLRKYLKSCFIAIKQPDIFRPLLLCFLITALYIFLGKLVCAVYSIEMMKKLSRNQSTVYIGVLILDGFTVLGMYVACGLSKIFKRRTLLLSTSITGTIFLFALSFYLYLTKLSVLPENDYVIIAMLVAYSLAVCFGPAILSISISAELIPMRFRSFCVLVYSTFCLMLMSTTLKVAPYVFNMFGFHGAYLGFGICSAICVTFVYKYLPETKDWTLHEIAEIFKPKGIKQEATQSKLLNDTK
ncbi:hypothetical protein ABMA27_001407 [Loxostege sticticalis]|uniref:Major facilitator superfamily (MFS) profile domain-containing protein n=1 Tax=Loxostege sticticalis TaxID=481309 RepID=A0ABR3HYD9_LOXSC